MKRKLLRSSRVLTILSTSLVALLIGVPIVVFFYFKSLFTVEQSLAFIWQITIPDAYRVLYNESEPSFQGEGARFTVFDTSQYEVISHTANVGATAQRRNSEVEEFFLATITALDVPIEYQPDFTKGYTWEKRENINQGQVSVLMMLYKADESKLYIAQYIK